MEIRYKITILKPGILFTTRKNNMIRSPFTRIVKKDEYGYWMNEIKGKALSKEDYTVDEIKKVLVDSNRDKMIKPDIKYQEIKNMKKSSVPARNKKVSYERKGRKNENS